MRDIQAALADPPTRRTVQRWLLQLEAEGRLRKEGSGRATRYVFGGIVEASADLAAGDGQTGSTIDLSPEAGQLKGAVERPQTQRAPVGYDRDFLDAYRPNNTFYLSASLRAELRAVGQAAASVGQPAGTYARQLLNRLLIDLSWNSSRLEGNTYSLLETERLVSEGQIAAGKDALEAQMILNHKAAIEFLVESASDIGFNRYTVLNLHALLADNLLDDPTASGRLRRIAVGISHSEFVPLEGPQRIEECFQQVLDTAAAIIDPFEQAFFAMVHLPYLQPFEDVNKRVSRLAANIPFIRSNLCPLSFVDVPQSLYTSATLSVYELKRVELLRDVFAWAYRRSCARYSAVRQSLGEPDPFRLRYRDLLYETVSALVRGGMDKQQAIVHIHQRAQDSVPELDRPRFIEVAETEALSLHEGNIARYRLRPSEYAHWRTRWT
ncbi:Fic family protein [Variovorax sp. J22R133]|uniref:Fic family protein n=1 Tax=Variovorax brevis TaxID=3053503 RepID=UPI00257796A3|nr:Fic family protein [Variovorax sp. J22R133]MDM0114724.1 Fic family protein [Variovorax sp. J22R133]